MILSDVVFFFLAAVILFSAIGVLVLKNPIHSALCLAGTMVAIGLMFLSLDAYFIAGVQLIVYAGAVMVLFVMVLMLFDLKEDGDSYSGGVFGRTLKLMAVFLIIGSIAGAMTATVNYMGLSDKPMALGTPAEQMAGVKTLAIEIFTRYIFSFELLGVLLLLIAIGVVAVSRSKGGSHAKPE
jgi:NADH-quinone oxidoreductase subunit J